MDGILCIDKPAEHTSFDVIARMRGILGTRKIGHAGTLDPMTTGVLPILIGRATKASDMLPIQDKQYTASFRLGVTTDTQDIFGTVLSECEVGVSAEEFTAAIKSFVGEQMQIPPMYSAVQVNGQRLYDLAREGREVERKARPVVFHEIDIIEMGDDYATISVHCSKGSYIRTLCHDIGAKLGCGAALTELRRTMAAGFTLEDCITIEQAAKYVSSGTIEQYIKPIATVFDMLPKVHLSEGRSRLYQNGHRLDYRRLGLQHTDSDIAVYSDCGEFLGISYLDRDSGELRLRKLFKI